MWGGLDSSRMWGGLRPDWESSSSEPAGMGETDGVDSMECSALTRAAPPWSMFCIRALNSGVSSSSLETTSWTSLSQARADWRASTVSTVIGCCPARLKEAGEGGGGWSELWLTMTEEGLGEPGLSI